MTKYGIENVVGPSTSGNVVTPEMRVKAYNYVCRNSTSDEDRDTLLSMLGLDG